MMRALAVGETAEGGGVAIRQYRCPTCRKLLLQSNVQLAPGDLLVGYCASCKREVVFVAADKDVA